MTMDQFIEHSKSLMGMSTDIYVKLLMPFDSLLETCLETEGIEKKDSDENFCEALKKDIVNKFCYNFCKILVSQWRGNLRGCDKMEEFCVS